MGNEDRTERQPADELAAFRQQVAESEVFRSLFRESSVGTVVVTPNGRFVQANRAFRDFLGYSEPELIGRTVGSITHPEDRDASSEAIRRAAESVAPIVHLEKRYLHKSGRVLWGEVTSTLIHDARGEPSYFVTQVLDITERKQAEEALRESEQRYRQLADSTPDVIYILDETGKLLYANRAAGMYYGVDPESLVGKTQQDLFPSEMAKTHLERIRRVFETGHIGDREYLYRFGDREVWLNVRTIPLRDEKGRVTSLMGICRDVTERKQAEDALANVHRELENRVEERTAELRRANELLRQSHDELEAIYDAMVDGLLVTDVETLRFRRANAAICRMLGYSEMEMLSLALGNIHPPEIVPRIVEQIRLVERADHTVPGHVPCLRKDGSVFQAEVIGKFLVYDGRPCSMGIIRDVTERLQAQESLERERQSLWRMLQASDHERQLIAYDIHDGLAQYLAAAGMQFQVYDSLRESSPAEARKAYEAAVQLVHQAHSESRRLISEVRHPVIDERGLESAILSLVYEQRQRGGPRIECHTSVEFDRLPPILENALYRMVQEALTNACRHSKSKKVTVSLLQEGQEVRLEVRDEGMGFDAEAVGKDHFGLESIRQRARLLGGRLTIESTPGSGTLVRVVVPILERQDDD